MKLFIILIVSCVILQSAYNHGKCVEAGLCGLSLEQIYLDR